MAGEIIGGLVAGGVILFVVYAIREGIESTRPARPQPAQPGWQRWLSGEIDWSTTTWWQRELYAFVIAAGVALVGLVLAWIWPDAFDRATVLASALGMFVAGSVLAAWRGRQGRSGAGEPAPTGNNAPR